MIRTYRRGLTHEKNNLGALFLATHQSGLTLPKSGSVLKGVSGGSVRSGYHYAKILFATFIFIATFGMYSKLWKIPKDRKY